MRRKENELPEKNFLEAKKLLMDGLQPCPTGREGYRLLAEVGQAARCIAHALPKFQQQELKAAWLSWAGVDHPPPTGGPRRRKLCELAWERFRPRCNLDLPSGQNPYPGEVVFYGSDPRSVEPLLVPQSYYLLDGKGRPLFSVRKDTLHGASEARVKVGDLLGTFRRTPHIHGVVEVTRIALDRGEIELLPVRGDFTASHQLGEERAIPFVITIADLAGVDVVRRGQPIVVNGQDVAPAYILPSPDDVSTASPFSDSTSHYVILHRQIHPDLASPFL